MDKNNSADTTIDNDKNICLTDDYYIKKQLGSGAFAEVILIEDKKSNKNYALKLIPNSSFVNMPKNISHYYRKEVDTLEKITHENIIKLIGYGTFNSSNKDFEMPETKGLILEFADNGCLFDYIYYEKKAFPENVARKIFLEILNGVGCLHQNELVHGDLKTENILLNSDWTIKLCDFGNCYSVKDIHNFNALFGSTKQYCSPELLNGFNINEYGQKSDVFSLGIILFILVTGGIPFEDSSNANKYYKRIKYKDFSIFSFYEKKYNTTFSKEFQELFLSMVKFIAYERPTIEEIKNSDWMKQTIADDYETEQEFIRRKIVVSKML